MFDVDKFIQCVRENPAIWDKGSKHYSDRNLKERSWYIVGESMFDAWEELPDLERQEQVKEIKNKWRHIRDSFGKYINQIHSGDIVHKKRKYIYADALSFLLQTVDRKKALDEEHNSMKYKEEPDDTLEVIEYEFEDPLSTNDSVKIEENIFISENQKDARKRNRANAEGYGISETDRSTIKLSRSAHERHLDNKDMCSLYGELLARKLRDFDDYNRTILMNDIDNLVFRAKMQQLPEYSTANQGTSHPISF